MQLSEEKIQLNVESSCKLPEQCFPSQFPFSQASRNEFLLVRTTSGIRWNDNRGGKRGRGGKCEGIRQFLARLRGIRENFLGEAIRCNNRFLREGSGRIPAVGYRTSAV